ncbi:Haloacid dehalogenase-like hydrolase family protein [Musa troglodytarum]|uniref:Haloacid dehalogenase-like hydrolase family protein n=1 Tax=Musa troglodytarum TaxID=320322 RepID=A0A9E7JAT4_9LILI|nr:Haloacid dehalogenase-like hydrolase family protein [Musa troglodytarum]
MEAAVSEAKYECLLFDLDDTLYPFSSGICVACGKNIEEYMLHHLQIEESQIPEMCLELYKEYGTTIAGLKVLGYKFDNDEYHAYVHGKLPYHALKPDPLLRNLLLSMPQRKMIFTNADKAHAAKVLSRLGLENCFEGIICFETLNPPDTEKVTTTLRDNLSNTDRATCQGRILCKPSLEAIETAIRIANIDPKKTIFFDDSAKNIAAGKAAGLHTVLVGRSVPVPGADLALESIHNIKEALPEIWQVGKQTEPVLAATPVEETTVLA